MRSVLLGLLAATSLVAQTPPPRMVPDWVEAGPMIGHVGTNRALIWLRVTKGVKLQARATMDGSQPRIGNIKKLGDRVRIIEFDQLQADKDLLVQVYQGQHPTRGVAISLHTAPMPSQSGRIRIAFGSCLNDVLYKNFPVFPAVASMRTPPGAIRP